MSSTAMLNALSRFPLPQFGSVATLVLWGRHSSRSLGPASLWSFPFIVGGTWFMWPAIDPEFKQSIGISGPDAKLKAAEAAADAARTSGVPLDNQAKAAIANAYKAAAPTAADMEVSKQIASGDFSALEKEWDAFAHKAAIPGEEDDDDDEDEEEEDEEEEEDDDE
mmetsp:Transcript_8118/g.18833  ORF Transcript_8118/g.18833 Transcript_8118/m.18833 type:complete len:166 (-) Transcript_8118:132-629(-)|eukprot:CAMPEP_0116844078 /NCGR_PEP_ID=MMETSP0418-20121206/12463_1 /TAXON_ID=1158023 /ORGANISM="Astrosyne radiata, Strain 13vi08-1A" /LENGTH=165 /DNA_ID=CAMNT_0004474941 /DNA_START=121 /DNA_END=618 /DNA_ORIENTATION=+